MEISLEISRNAVFAQVARRTEWQGTRAPEDRDYERLALSPSDKSLFHSFFDEAAMHAIDICRPMLQRVANTDESLSMTLHLSDCQDTESLKTTVGNMLTWHVLALWQEILSTQRSVASFARLDDYALKLQGILYHNPIPVRIKS